MASSIFKLDTRDSKWLKQSDNVGLGPGSYDGANTTMNTWNRQQSRGMSRGLDEARGSYMGESDLRSINNVPFNSKIERKDYDKINQKYNPGPGTYINVQKTSAFKSDFITKDNINERKIFS